MSCHAASGTCTTSVATQLCSLSRRINWDSRIFDDLHYVRSHPGGFMNPDVPYMMSVTNLHKILDAIQRAGAPEVFHLDFLKDLGFKGSNDRGAVKLLKYLGMLDGSGRPQAG